LPEVIKNKKNMMIALRAIRTREERRTKLLSNTTSQSKLKIGNELRNYIDSAKGGSRNNFVNNLASEATMSASAKDFYHLPPK
jgi:hypothetical protein